MSLSRYEKSDRLALILLLGGFSALVVAIALFAAGAVSGWLAVALGGVGVTLGAFQSLLPVRESDEYLSRDINIEYGDIVKHGYVGDIAEDSFEREDDASAPESSSTVNCFDVDQRVPAPIPIEPIQFLAAYPAILSMGRWAPLWAYAFGSSEYAEVAEDADLQSRENRPQAFSTAVARMVLEAGVVLTATPRGEGLEFDPPRQSVIWRGRWRRFDFRACPAAEPRSPEVRGTISFSVEGLVVADLPFQCLVGDASGKAGETRSSQGRLYEAIFPSYSHLDRQIVERVERAYRALGLSYLRDVTALRSGAKWRPEIERLIVGADAFQLFWSRAAEASENVTKEWQTALRLIATRRKEETFIRPVFWEQPMPPAPEQLEEIHFAYEPDLVR